MAVKPPDPIVPAQSAQVTAIWGAYNGFLLAMQGLPDSWRKSEAEKRLTEARMWALDGILLGTSEPK